MQDGVSVKTAKLVWLVIQHRPPSPHSLVPLAIYKSALIARASGIQHSRARQPTNRDWRRWAVNKRSESRRRSGIPSGTLRKTRSPSVQSAVQESKKREDVIICNREDLFHQSTFPHQRLFLISNSLPSGNAPVATNSAGFAERESLISLKPDILCITPLEHAQVFSFHRPTLSTRKGNLRASLSTLRRTACLEL